MFKWEAQETLTFGLKCDGLRTNHLQVDILVLRYTHVTRAVVFNTSTMNMFYIVLFIHLSFY
jgi:hypothetical protein